jgi:hypothetical protein
MSDIHIELDWTRMLGFDQASPGPDPFRHSPKIGPKDARGFGQAMAEEKSEAETSRRVASLQAKVGLKSVGVVLQAKVGNKDRIRR